MNVSNTPESRRYPLASTRGERAERAIADSVLDLIDECGVAELTMDKVAARARVGKPTIYRRWSNKAEMVAFAFSNIGPPLVLDPALDLRSNMIAVLENLRSRMTDTRHGRAWRKLLGSEDEYGQALRQYVRQYLGIRRAELAALVEEHIASGEYDARIEVDTLMRILANAMLGSLMMPDEPESTSDPATLVDLALFGGLPPRGNFSTS